MKITAGNTKIRIEMALSVSVERAWGLLTSEIHIANWWGAAM